MQKCKVAVFFVIKFFMAKRLIEKEVLKVGKWIHPSAPNGILEVTKDYLKKLADNFSTGKIPAPVLRGHRNNEEAEAKPELILTKNIKELQAKDNSLVARFEIEESELDKYNDVSASISPDYKDKETGNRIGPVLSHVAMVINPYIKGLQTFVPLEDTSEYNILLSEVTMDEDKKDLEIETETGKPVEETTTETTAETETKEEEKEEAVETKEEETPTVDNSETSDAIAIQLAEVQEENRLLKAQAAKANALNSFETLLRKGKVLPTMKEEFVMLAEKSTETIDLSDGSKKSVSELLVDLFDKMPAMINLEEKGVNVELGDKSASMPSDIHLEMKARYMKLNPNASEEDFAKYLAKNKSIIDAEVSKLKKK